MGPTARTFWHLMTEALEEIRGGRDNQRWRAELCMGRRMKEPVAGRRRHSARNTEQVGKACDGGGGSSLAV